MTDKKVGVLFFVILFFVVAAARDDRTANASDKRPRPLARYGQNDRAMTLGRKNWLFAGSNRGGDACAIAMSLISTAKAHGHDPLAYLTDVLTRLPRSSSKDLDALLPMQWKPAKS